MNDVLLDVMAAAGWPEPLAAEPWLHALCGGDPASVDWTAAEGGIRDRAESEGLDPAMVDAVVQALGAAGGVAALVALEQEGPEQLTARYGRVLADAHSAAEGDHSQFGEGAQGASTGAPAGDTAAVDAAYQWVVQALAAEDVEFYQQLKADPELAQLIYAEASKRFGQLAQ